MREAGVTTLADQWAVLVAQFAGQPLPLLPAIAGRIFRRERTALLLALVFGDDSEQTEPQPVKRLKSVMQILDDP